MRKAYIPKPTLAINLQSSTVKVMLAVLIDVDLLATLVGLALYFTLLAVTISAFTVMFAHVIVVVEILSYSLRKSRREADALSGET